jgi:phosphotransferase system HPr (HPr) family protein
VRTASKFLADITVTNLTREGAPVDAKNILGVLTISVAQNHTVRLTAQGADEELALDSLVRLIETNFGETPQG